MPAQEENKACVSGASSLLRTREVTCRAVQTGVPGPMRNFWRVDCNRAAQRMKALVAPAILPAVEAIAVQAGKMLALLLYTPTGNGLV